MEPGRVVRLLLFLTLSFLWENSQALDSASDFSYLGSSFSLEPSGGENSMEELCVLWYTGGAAQGSYAVELIVEDYPRAAVTLTHTQGTRTIPPYSSTGAPLSSTPLHFTVTVEGESSECKPGLARPGFTEPTPANGETVSVLPYDEVAFTISAVSSDMVSDIAVLGPPGLVLSKLWEGQRAGVRVVSANVSWTGTSRKDPRSKPICFSASTKRFQSEPRCIWIAQQVTIAPPPGTGAISMDILKQAHSAVLCGDAFLASCPTVLQCLEERMKLFLPRTALPQIGESDLQLIDPACNITGNSTHFLLDIPLTGCGTRIQEEDSYLVLVNVVSSRVSSQAPGAVITRIPSLRFPLACRFKAGGQVTGEVSVPQGPKDEAFGKFTFDIKFRRELPAAVGAARVGDVDKMDTPFELDPSKPLYLQVNASCNITGVELVVESCWISETKNTTRSGDSSFIDQGCMAAGGKVQLVLDELNEKIYQINLTSLIPARIVPEVSPPASCSSCPSLCRALLHIRN
ncbi:ZP domain-containing protein [Acipenser ruthenus]|uniref:ZP domain-containing protein n=1 Tax=Acipenser ruthenus TaxID=7906 RepID=A0A444UH63_ACIRT|nr:ZP domain-containing protein [Acipenser ruthenus]